MKKQLLGLSVLTAFLSMSAFAAGPVANIQVTGDIKPPTCTVNGATQNDVIFDLGKISPSLIPQSDFYLYPSTAIKNVVVIDCDAETYLAFSAIDAYEGSSTIDTAGSSYSDYYFKLVDAKNTSETVGGIIFKWNNVTVDGVDAFLSKDNTGTTQGNAPTYMVKDAMTAWTKTQQNRVEADNLDMISGKVFSAEFSQPNNESYAAFISSRNALSNNNIDIDDGLDFIGEAILTFSFGV